MLFRLFFWNSSHSFLRIFWKFKGRWILRVSKYTLEIIRCFFLICQIFYDLKCLCFTKFRNLIIIWLYLFLIWTLSKKYLIWWNLFFWFQLINFCIGFNLKLNFRFIFFDSLFSIFGFICLMGIIISLFHFLNLFIFYIKIF